MKKNFLIVLLAVVMAAFSLTGCKSMFGPEDPWVPKSWAPLTGYSRLARAESFSGLIQAVIQAAVDNRVVIRCSWEGYTPKEMSPDTTQEGYFTYQAEQKVEAPQSGLKEYRMRAVDGLFDEHVSWGLSVDGKEILHYVHEAGVVYGIFWLDRFGNVITNPQGS